MPRIEKKIRLLSPDNPLPVIDVTIGDRSYVALLDTGATINLICSIPKGWTFIGTKNLKTFSGESKVPFSNRTYKVGGLTCKGFMLMNNAGYPFLCGIDLVLGTPFFEKNNVILDFKEKTLVALI